MFYPIAEVVPEWAGPLSSIGIAGTCLWWLMVRVETRMRETDRRMVAIENAANRTTRAILLLVISMQHANETARVEATKINGEIDEAERERRAEDNVQR